MTTTRRRLRIPTVTLAPLAAFLVMSAAACSSDDDGATTTEATSAITSGEVTTTTPTTTSAATITTDETDETDPTVATAATVATVAPEITVATVAPNVSAADPNDVMITVIAGVDSGDDRIELIPLGATVTLSVSNPDRDDEFHVHGYELGDGVEVPAGQSETFTFTADQAGQFEVESHTTEAVLLILEVG